LTIRSTPEIRYGSNGFRIHTCFEVPLQCILSPERGPASNRAANNADESFS
jgi:hypothetical protein